MMGQESNTPIRGAIVGSLISIAISATMFGTLFLPGIDDKIARIGCSSLILLCPLFLLTTMIAYISCELISDHLAVIPKGNKTVPWKIKVARILGMFAAGFAVFTCLGGICVILLMNAMKHFSIADSL